MSMRSLVSPLGVLAPQLAAALARAGAVLPVMNSGYVKVDSSPLDAFLEKLSLSVMRSESEIVKLREDNKSLRTELVSSFNSEAEIEKLRNENSLLRKELTATHAADTQNLRAQLIQLAEKVHTVTEQWKAVHHISEQVKTLEQRLDIKADIHSVAELRDQVFTFTRSLQETAGGLSAHKIETAKNTKELKSHICAVQDQFTEQFAILNQTKANKSDAANDAVVGDSWKQHLERVQRACERDLKALGEELTLFKTHSSQQLAQKIGSDELKEVKSDIENMREETIGMIKSQNKVVSEQFQRTEKQIEYNLEKMDEVQSHAVETTGMCKKITAELLEFRRTNKEFISRSEQELAKKVGIEAVQMLLKDKATKKDCEEIIQNINYEFDEKLVRSNRFMQNLREDIDVLLTMIMQDVHESQSKDAKGTASGSVRCISCCRPIATPRRRLLLKSLSSAPSRSSSASPHNSHPALADQPGRPTSPASHVRSSSALGRW